MSDWMNVQENDGRLAMRDFLQCSKEPSLAWVRGWEEDKRTPRSSERRTEPESELGLGEGFRGVSPHSAVLQNHMRS